MMGQADPSKLASLLGVSAPEGNSESQQKQKSKNNKIVEVVLPARKKPVVQKSISTGENVAASIVPVKPVVEVPFVNVRPLTEVQRRDVPREKHIPAYQTKAPVEASSAAKDVVNLILNAPVGTTVGQLLGSSPALLKEISRHISKVRVPVKPVNSSNVNIAEEEDRRDWYDEYLEDDDDAKNRPVDPDVDLSSASQEEPNKPSEPVIKIEPSQEPAKPKDKRVRIELQVEDLPKYTTFTILPETSDLGEKGTIVVTDPIVQYLDSLVDSDGHIDINLIAKEALPIRAVYPMINKIDHEESLLDGGSEICSMAKAIAISLGIAWQPDITINMQSAQGHVETTLGLARNVLFDFCGLKFLMQLHIINDPPYKILLGRPFEVVSAANIINETTGDQTITLTDPRNGQKLVVPTFDRGKPPSEQRKTIVKQMVNQVFPASMI